MTDPAALRKIAAQLRTLVSTSPTASDGVGEWTLGAGEVYDAIREKHPGLLLPFEVQHYLNDADIRAREPEYREQQDRMMLEVIGKLELGVVPKGHVVSLPIFPGLRLSFRRACLPWFAGIVFVILGLGFWWCL